MTEDWLRLNRENWDDRARVHADSDFYDLPGFRAGACTLREFETAEVGDVSGRSLLHLQCHMGQDTLSWARRGAAVTGVDFSEPAIRTARGLAEDIGAPARFVASDVYAVPEALGGERFDIVYTGIGALVWLPDLTRWARVVADALVDGGFLYLAEFHPMTDVLGEDGRSVAEGYFDGGGEVSDYPRTYTDGRELTRTVTVEWRHPLGDVVTALAGAGLRVEFLHEHPFTLFQRYPGLRRDGNGVYRFPPDRPQVPLMYSLRARQRNVRPSPR
ncbi:methyltransferase domain-containing protein [Nocardiopsis aegyptia]|uniref:SAM-dependent methyltransferase n=1 Tax=Nocardiopsis aegyptia TaxID=220378 RepID=A0A7Z0J9M8_9ACTN|nr:methyltransferase domain-containing protein [Nocardiopsis aegyptia]NYJ33872.1 SAM-dependent methyltransferase [Nocardiopsis aegyptia]